MLIPCLHVITLPTLPRPKLSCNPRSWRQGALAYQGRKGSAKRSGCSGGTLLFSSFSPDVPRQATLPTAHGAASGSFLHSYLFRFQQGTACINRIHGKTRPKALFYRDRLQPAAPVSSPADYLCSSGTHQARFRAVLPILGAHAHTVP